ncbi:hypothetical protein FRB97_003339, partial [Tulasnella sp. 331]
MRFTPILVFFIATMVHITVSAPQSATTSETTSATASATTSTTPVQDGGVPGKAWKRM